MQLILAENTSAWNGPEWVLVILLITAILSFISSLGVATVGWYIYGVRDRMSRIENRLQRGDDQFERIGKEQATLAVDAALKNGDLQKLMFRDFVPRQDFRDHTERFSRFEIANTKQLSSVESKMDVLIGLEKARQKQYAQMEGHHHAD